jgi:hypothetical protein
MHRIPHHVNMQEKRFVYVFTAIWAMLACFVHVAFLLLLMTFSSSPLDTRFESKTCENSFMLLQGRSTADISSLALTVRPQKHCHSCFCSLCAEHFQHSPHHLEAAQLMKDYLFLAPLPHQLEFATSDQSEVCLKKPGLIERFARTLKENNFINVRFCHGADAFMPIHHGGCRTEKPVRRRRLVLSAAKCPAARRVPGRMLYTLC